MSPRDFSMLELRNKGRIGLNINEKNSKIKRARSQVFIFKNP